MDASVFVLVKEISVENFDFLPTVVLKDSIGAFTLLLSIKSE